ncbi:SPRY-domain-containing protein [Hesseltinella vesiculosa]|uniref:SPRY-domain-containing protein n=1 Tax=Hesseltinella vesiculosa TaxID=101127 RepID=A0A1X2GQ78_9FUNG|nr:SPRY-domain-containing protein [Hesseltinella vesiculosa]
MPLVFQSMASRPVLIGSGTIIVFPQGMQACCVSTSMAIPTRQPVAYWEVTIVSMTDALAVGLATRPYPPWRLPGWHQHSIGYHSGNGSTYISDPLLCDRYGPTFQQGDVIGIGYLTRTGTVFFTKNGRYLGKALTEFHYPLYPVVGSVGSAKVEINLGRQGNRRKTLKATINFKHLCYAVFRFQRVANEWRAGVVGEDDARPPPPLYGDHFEDSLLDDTPRHTEDMDSGHTFTDQRSPDAEPPRYTSLSQGTQQAEQDSPAHEASPILQPNVGIQEDRSSA